MSLWSMGAALRLPRVVGDPLRRRIYLRCKACRWSREIQMPAKPEDLERAAEQAYEHSKIFCLLNRRN